MTEADARIRVLTSQLKKQKQKEEDEEKQQNHDRDKKEMEALRRELEAKKGEVESLDFLLSRNVKAHKSLVEENNKEVNKRKIAEYLGDQKVERLERENSQLRNELRKVRHDACDAAQKLQREKDKLVGGLVYFLPFVKIIFRQLSRQKMAKSQVSLPN